MVDCDDVIDLCNEVRPILDKETSLIRLSNNLERILVVGDTHGDYDTTNEIVQKFKSEEYDQLIFLGDYVDRGPKDIQNINFLLKLKTMEPKKVILLRGNHEFPAMNLHYGFINQVLNYFKQDADEVYNEYRQIFSRLPYSVLLNNILMLHGGVPIRRSKEPYTLKDINNIPKNIKQLEDLPDVGQQLIWNDPKETINEDQSSYRGIGYFFGARSFKYFMDENKLEYLIRSHEAFLGGSRLFFDGRLISIFTCRYYQRGIKIAEIINNDIKVIDIK
ncbi:MAG: metallophosphoesterase [Candidatus Helarchaeota archaeon]